MTVAGSRAAECTITLSRGSWDHCHAGRRYSGQAEAKNMVERFF
jgi:hypothetical protein